MNSQIKSFVKVQEPVKIQYCQADHFIDQQTTCQRQQLSQETQQKHYTKGYLAVKKWRAKNPDMVKKYQKKHWKPKYNLTRKKYKTCKDQQYLKSGEV